MRHPAIFSLLLGATVTACSHPMVMHGPRIRPGVASGFVLPYPTRGIPYPDGRPRQTLLVLPYGAYMSRAGRFAEEQSWKPGWLVGLQMGYFDLIPRGTAYVELTNPTSPIALGFGTTVGTNLGQLYAMVGGVQGESSIFAIARATSMREPRQTSDALHRALTSTTSLGGGLELPLAARVGLRTVVEFAHGRRSLPGSGGIVRQLIITAGIHVSR